MHSATSDHATPLSSRADRAVSRGSAAGKPRAARSGLRHAGALALVVCGVAAVASACQEPTPAQEWTPADHDNRRVLPQRRLLPGDDHQPPSKSDQLTEVTWKAQCAGCHGPRGRGDGPMSPMVQAKDLSAADWQDSVTDAAMAEIVKKGKGRMPAVNLPDPTIQKLVALVRTFRRPGSKRGATAPATAGAMGKPSRAPR